MQGCRQENKATCCNISDQLLVGTSQTHGITQAYTKFIVPGTNISRWDEQKHIKDEIDFLSGENFI